MAGRLCERTVTGDHGASSASAEGDVHGIVCGDVVSQLPCARQEIEVGVTVEIEIGEIARASAARPATPHRSYEAAEGLSHLHIHQVRRVELVLVAEEPRLDPCAERRLQEELQQRRRVDDDHADSRSSRMTRRPASSGHPLSSAVEPGQHLLACRPPASRSSSASR